MLKCCNLDFDISWWNYVLYMGSLISTSLSVDRPMFAINISDDRPQTIVVVSVFCTVCKPISKKFYYCISDFVILRVLLCSEQIIKMNNDSCVLKYIEIVPLDDSAHQLEDIKPFEVKVCIVTHLVA